MLGIDFSELGLIVVVALVVLGPKRLPGLVRKIGRWVGKARSMARDFQQQLENEVNLDELNRMTENLTREATQTRPSPPPEAFDDPAAQPVTTPPAGDAGAGDPTTSGYPYGAQTSDPATLSDTPPDATPQLGDDSYSHAHAHGEAPVTDEPAVADVDASQKKDSDAA